MVSSSILEDLPLVSLPSHSLNNPQEADVKVYIFEFENENKDENGNLLFTACAVVSGL